MLGRPYEGNEEEVINEKAHVLDSILPVAVLIASCIVAMVNLVDFLRALPFVHAFAASDASVGLVIWRCGHAGIYIYLLCAMVFSKGRMYPGGFS